MNTAFYASIIYGNTYVLYPFLYKEGGLFMYGIFSAIFIFTPEVSSGILTSYVYNTCFTAHREPINPHTLLSFIAGAFLDFMRSFIIRIILAYYTLKEQTEDIMWQKREAALNLLNSQVQLHFLFNTLNNIYYEVYWASPVLPISLSHIMRYFVDDSREERVFLATEGCLVKNYIKLERIPVRHNIEIHFIKQCASLVYLLITFVGNLFKHGMNKLSNTNKIEISLLQEQERLLFRTTDRPRTSQTLDTSCGFGLKNLREHLYMLLGDNCELNTDQLKQSFTAFLKICLS